MENPRAKQKSSKALALAVPALIVTVAATLAISLPRVFNSRDSNVHEFFLPNEQSESAERLQTATPVPAGDASLAAIAVPPEALANAGLSERNAAELSGQLAAMVVEPGLATSVSIAVTDMNTGVTLAYRGDELQRSGCVVNLFVLVQALRDVADGSLAFEEIEWIVESIAGYSDAAAAFELYALVGGGDVLHGLERVSQLMHETIGPGMSVLDHPPGFEWDSLGIDENNYISALAMNIGLASLFRGDLLPEPWGSYLLDVMANVTPGLNYLLANLPADAVVSHKNGWFDYDDGNVENDTAIVRYTRDGIPSAYVITFLSDSPDVWLSINLAQSVTSLVYTWFGGVIPANEFVASPEDDSWVAPVEADAAQTAPEIAGDAHESVGAPEEGAEPEDAPLAGEAPPVDERPAEALENDVSANEADPET